MTTPSNRSRDHATYETIWGPFHSLETDDTDDRHPGWFHTVDYAGAPRRWHDDDDESWGGVVDAESPFICPPWTLADPLPLQHWVFLPLYGAGCLFLCVGIVVLAEQAVVPTLAQLCSRAHWGLDPTFSAAIVVASLTSAPSLFASLLGVFLGSTSSTGTGACVGSALINQTAVVGAAIAVAAREQFQHHDSSDGRAAASAAPPSSMTMRVAVDPPPVLRDLLFCGGAVAALLAIVADGDISALEALALLVVSKRSKLAACLSGPYLRRLIGLLFGQCDVHCLSSWHDDLHHSSL